MERPARRAIGAHETCALRRCARVEHALRRDEVEARQRSQRRHCGQRRACVARRLARFRRCWHAAAWRAREAHLAGERAVDERAVFAHRGRAVADDWARDGRRALGEEACAPCRAIDAQLGVDVIDVVIGAIGGGARPGVGDLAEAALTIPIHTHRSGRSRERCSGVVERGVRGRHVARTRTRECSGRCNRSHRLPASCPRGTSAAGVGRRPCSSSR